MKQYVNVIEVDGEGFDALLGRVSMTDQIKSYLPAEGWTTPETPQPPPLSEYMLGLAVMSTCLAIAWLGMQP